MLRTCRHPLAILVSCLAIAFAGCGGDDEDTEADGATGATGAAGAESTDVDAQAAARTAQTAIETYATSVEQNGSYAGADAEVLREIEPNLPDDIEVDADRSSYSITVPSESGNAFTLERAADGTVTRTCTEPGVGDCPESGDW